MPLTPKWRHRRVYVHECVRMLYLSCKAPPLSSSTGAGSRRVYLIQPRYLKPWRQTRCPLWKFALKRPLREKGYNLFKTIFFKYYNSHTSAVTSHLMGQTEVCGCHLSKRRSTTLRNWWRFCELKNSLEDKCVCFALDYTPITDKGYNWSKHLSEAYWHQ